MPWQRPKEEEEEDDDDLRANKRSTRNDFGRKKASIFEKKAQKELYSYHPSVDGANQRLPKWWDIMTNALKSGLIKLSKKTESKQ